MFQIQLVSGVKVLHDYSIFGSLYSELYHAYKFALSVPTTQVTCERAFSKLKIVKNRLRPAISQDLLVFLMLINVEGGNANVLDYDKIIDDLGKTSAEL